MSPLSCRPLLCLSLATFTVNCRVPPQTLYTPDVYTGIRPSCTLRKARQPPAASTALPSRSSAGSKAGAPNTVTCVRYNGAELILILPDSSPEKYSTYLWVTT
ncbi:hypothetical protein L798_11144 [Zootermopsis nevadensis]|uniref:Secreted protein n=1 Tax=Zootermopsis nevadensis TaxID=136037 RepID=A0A067RIS0_ZOONE|nr:hypothetical protein L798_11144 [Zootermopsis nevadensis]